jgi:hypothetical protein
MAGWGKIQDRQPTMDQQEFTPVFTGKLNHGLSILPAMP